MEVPGVPYSQPVLYIQQLIIVIKVHPVRFLNTPSPANCTPVSRQIKREILFTASKENVNKIYIEKETINSKGSLKYTYMMHKSLAILNSKHLMCVACCESLRLYGLVQLVENNIRSLFSSCKSVGK